MIHTLSVPKMLARLYYACQHLIEEFNGEYVRQNTGRVMRCHNHFCIAQAAVNWYLERYPKGVEVLKGTAVHKELNDAIAAVEALMVQMRSCYEDIQIILNRTDLITSEGREMGGKLSQSISPTGEFTERLRFLRSRLGSIEVI